MNLLIETSDIEVTETTRFWLETTLYTYGRRDHRTFRAELKSTDRFKVEVAEAQYRSAYAETFGLATDMTHPLDDYWWTMRCVWAEPGQGYLGAEIWRRYGGEIDQ